MKVKLNIFIILLLSAVQVFAGKPELISSQRTFYAGRKFSLHLKGAANDTATYRLKYANRTVAAGHFNFDKNGSKVLELNFPEIKAHVIAEAEIIFKTSDGVSSENIYFFPVKGFDQQESAISIFGQVKELKQDLETFGAQVLPVGDISQTQTEALIVYGMNFDQFPGIEKALEKLCEVNRKIIFIDSKGTLNWPADLRQLNLYDRNFVKLIDKRFDIQKELGSLAASERDDRPVLKMVPGVKGLCFCKMKFGKGEVFFLSEGFLKDIKFNPSVLFLIKSIIGGK